jgi:hypothetical protein
LEAYFVISEIYIFPSNCVICYITTVTAVTSFLQILNESLKKKEKIRDYLAQIMQRKEEDENALIKKAAAEKGAK